MTPLAVLTIIVLVACAVLLAFKVIPVYIEYYGVVASVKSFKQDFDLAEKGEPQIRELLKRRFEVNDVKRVKQDQVKITRAGKTTTIAVKYDAKVPLVANVNLLLEFDHTATFP
jgi:hypothetical protein